jgi:hypothetical protein
MDAIFRHIGVEGVKALNLHPSGPNQQGKTETKASNQPRSRTVKETHSGQGDRRAGKTLNQSSYVPVGCCNFCSMPLQTWFIARFNFSPILRNEWSAPAAEGRESYEAVVLPGNLGL